VNKMRIASAIPLILFFLLLPSVIFGEISGASLSRLVSLSNSTSSQYSIPYEAEIGNDSYFLVAFSGKPYAYARIWEEGNQAYGQFVSGKDEALILVGKNLQDRHAAEEAKSLAVNATMRPANITEGFNSSQKDCRRMMGLDTHTCNSYDSCLKACNSVPSFCMQIAQQQGEKFIYALWQYQNDSGDLFSLAKKEREAAAAVKSSASENNLAAYATSLDNLDAVAQRLGKTGILVKEMYCSPIPFNLSSIDSARLEVARSRDLLYEISNAENSAAQFAQNGALLNGNSSLPKNLTAAIEKNQTNASDAAMPAENAASFGFLQNTGFMDLLPYALGAAGVMMAALLSAAFLYSKGEKK
jgi:hypothetical protein